MVFYLKDQEWGSWTKFANESNKNESKESRRDFLNKIKKSRGQNLYPREVQAEICIQKEKEERYINSVSNQNKKIKKINHQPEVHVQAVYKPKFTVSKRKRKKEH